MANVNTLNTAVAPGYVRRYDLTFFHEQAPQGEVFPLYDVNHGVDSFFKAIAICRLDLLMVDGSGKEIGWVRKIGISLTATADKYQSKHGRQVALLRAVDELSRAERQMILNNWFREHAGVHGARRGNAGKFQRLIHLAELSARAQAFVDDVNPDKRIARSKAKQELAAAIQAEAKEKVSA